MSDRKNEQWQYLKGRDWEIAETAPGGDAHIMTRGMESPPKPVSERQLQNRWSRKN